MKLFFDECYWLGDFEAWCDVSSGWVDGWDDPINWQVWFKAYDCEKQINDTETEYWEQRYEFDCVVRLICDPFGSNGMTAEWVLAEFPAKNVEEAERLLQVAADALYGEE